VLGELDSFSGQYTIDTTTIVPDRPIFGTSSSPIQNMMQDKVGFAPV